MKRPALFDTNILIDLFSGHRQAVQVLDDYSSQRAISLITWLRRRSTDVSF